MTGDKLTWERVSWEGRIPGQSRETWMAPFLDGFLVRDIVTTQERGPDQPRSMGVALVFVKAPVTISIEHNEMQDMIDDQDTPAVGEAVKRALDNNPPGTWVRSDGTAAAAVNESYWLCSSCPHTRSMHLHAGPCQWPEGCPCRKFEARA